MSSRFDRIVKLNNALNSAKAIMSSARMDTNAQYYEAIKTVMDAYDRETAKDLLNILNLMGALL